MENFTTIIRKIWTYVIPETTLYVSGILYYAKYIISWNTLNVFFKGSCICMASL